MRLPLGKTSMREARDMLKIQSVEGKQSIDPKIATIQIEHCRDSMRLNFIRSPVTILRAKLMKEKLG